jgi:limonene-1,2-epoxide hydrolase
VGPPFDIVQAFVDAFIAAWPSGDAEMPASFFTDDAVYQNGPLDPVHGRNAIRATLADFMAMGGEVAVDMGHVLAEGNLVMTERVDHFTLAGRRVSLPVMGVFVVRDGKISAWRDYFDLNQFVAQLDPGN